MAALPRTDVHRRLPLGDRVVTSFRVTTNATPDQAAEWVETGLSKIEAILNAEVIGTAPVAGGTITAPVAATATLDMTGDTPANTDTVTIDGIVYTLLTTIGTDRYNVLVNGTPATQATNLANAINGVGTPGTQYTLDTPPHPTFSAAAVGDTVVLTYRVPGTVGNGKVCSTDITGATLSNSAGGLDPVADPAGLNFRKNARGTGVAENTNPGDLGIESSGASTLVEVTLLGRP